MKESDKKIEWWVVCTDNIMTAATYGTSYKGLIVKRVFECETLAQARILRDRLEQNKKRFGLSRINIRTTTPSYSSKKYYVTREPYSDNIFKY